MSELFVGLDKPKVVLISNYIQKFCIIQTKKEYLSWKGNNHPFDYNEMIEIHFFKWKFKEILFNNFTKFVL